MRITLSDDLQVKKITREIFLPKLKEELRARQIHADHCGVDVSFDITYSLKPAINDIETRVIREIHAYHSNLKTLKSIFKSKASVKRHLTRTIKQEIHAIIQDYITNDMQYNLSDVEIRNDILRYHMGSRHNPVYQTMHRALLYLNKQGLVAGRDGNHLVVASIKGEKQPPLCAMLICEDDGHFTQILLQPDGSDTWDEFNGVVQPLYLQNKLSVEFVAKVLPALHHLLKESEAVAYA